MMDNIGNLNDSMLRERLAQRKNRVVRNSLIKLEKWFDHLGQNPPLKMDFWTESIIRDFIRYACNGVLNEVFDELGLEKLHLHREK